MALPGPRRNRFRGELNYNELASVRALITLHFALFEVTVLPFTYYLVCDFLPLLLLFLLTTLTNYHQLAN